MDNNLKQIIIIIVSITISIISFLKGGMLWESFGIKDEVALTYSKIGLSLLLLFVGFLITIFNTVQSIKTEILNTKTSLTKDLISTIPNLNTLSSYTGEEGLIHLTQKLNFTKLLLNTRLTPEDYGQIYSPKTQVWDNAIIKQIKQGLVLRDVVCSSGRISSENIKSKLLQDKNVSGHYKAVEVTFDFPSIINFSIVQFSDNSKEVWFGWVLTKGRELESKCFMSRDLDLVSMFENWHSDLFRHGKNI